MDTTLLTRLANSDVYIKKIFAGVFACDMLPKHKIRVKTLYIINTDPHDLEGEHWISLYINPITNDYVYFDSAGEKPNVYIKTFLLKNTKKYTYNSVPLQYPCSNVCGGYCLYFCYQTARGKTLNNIVTNFDPRRKRQNDHKIAKFIRTVFKHTFAEIPTDAHCSKQISLFLNNI